MRGGGSILRRLVVGLALATATLWLAGAALSGSILGVALDRTFDKALIETARRILPLAVAEIVNRGAQEGPERVASLLRGDDRFDYVVRGAAGKVLLQSADADPAAFPYPVRKGFVTTGTLRIYAEGAISDTYLVQVADPLATRRQAVAEAMLAFLAPLPFAIALAVAGIW